MQMFAAPPHPPSRVVHRLAVELDATGISIAAARDGRVVLSGAVRTWAEWDAAWRAAWTVPGVREVDNQLVLVCGVNKSGTGTQNPGETDEPTAG